MFGLCNTDKVCSGMIKAQYKYQVLVNHPDKAPEGKGEEYGKKFVEIQDAYDRLIRRCEAREAEAAEQTASQGEAEAARQTASSSVVKRARLL